MAALSFCSDQHCSCPGEWAAVFADTAANAQFGDDIRLQQVDLFPLIVDDFGLPEFNRLVRRWTMLLADDAGDSVGIGQTAVFVKIGPADDSSMLFLPGQFTDGPGRTHLAAEGAVVFTIADATDKSRTEDTLDTGFEPGRMECIADADLHALPAAHAATEELMFRQGTRRSDE